MRVVTRCITRERTTLLFARGGLKAAAFWLLRRVSGLVVYRFYACLLSRPGSAPPPPPDDGYSFLVLRSMADAAACPAGIIDQLDIKSGCGVAGILRNGGMLFAVLRGPRVAAQLRIDFGRVVVDTPTDLALDLGPHTAFLSFLWTAPDMRRRGLTLSLIRCACARLARDGVRVCVGHVRATNVASLNTFARAGWFPVAALLVTGNRRLLGIRHFAAWRRTGLTMAVTADPEGYLRPARGAVVETMRAQR